MQASYPPIRRIVTGHDEARVAKVLIDAPATNAKSPQPGLVSTMIWCHDVGCADVLVLGVQQADRVRRRGGIRTPLR